MSNHIGAQAIVIGAGIGGLSAAAALAPFFTDVVVLERDALASQAEQRSGVPQGRHAHVILSSGMNALQQLLPDFDKALAAAGAVRYQAGLDLLIERPGFDPFPQRDMGWQVYSASRPLLETTLRQALARLPNVTVRQRCSVKEILASDDGQRVTGLTFTHADGRAETCDATLVVDASGRAAPTLAFLQAHGHTVPQSSEIGVDFAYATAVFAMPQNAPDHWQAAMVFPDPRVSTLYALLLPIEGRRWMVSIGSAHGAQMPGDPNGFMDLLLQLRTPTIYNALRHAEREGEIARYAFPASTRRHFDHLPSFPVGLLPVGDSICRFNPVYGQGMSVAAMEAVALQDLLRTLAPQDQPLAKLAPAFFTSLLPVIETPWAVANLDFMYPQTRGERPADLDMTLKFIAALNRVAAREPAVHKLMLQVQHLLKPRSAYQDPAIMQQVMAEMQSAG
jgi:2-polyprenyl-6-methoxyphenol hydroxylase-like FAD-dependent oxidoreductase